MEERCCEDCFLEPELKKFIHKNGEPPEEPCHYCGSTTARTIDVSELQELFTPVVGEHYVTCDNLSQYRHADPSDGEALSWIMDEDFSVFSDDVDEKEDLLGSILNSGRDYKEPPVFETNDSWFRVDEDWGHRSLKDLNDEALDLVVEAIEKHGHNIAILMARGRLPKDVSSAYAEIVSELTHTSLSLPEGQGLWRARVGKWPSVEDVKPPPAHLAKPGRCNSGGQPVLYVAEQRDTAISEVRPAKSDDVTVAQFNLLRKTDVCDLLSVPITTSPFADFKRYQLEVRRRALADTVGRMLAIPVRPGDEPKEYLVTQVICRMIFDKGFDGIRYHSAQHDGGVNLVFLEAGVGAPAAASLDHVAIEKVTYKIA